MAYQLRSRKDPATTELQEQTDTSVEHPTEHQVTTSSQIKFIPQQLSKIQSVAIATAEANRALTTSDISTEPDVEIHPLLDTQGPTRFDPDLGSAPLTAQPSLAEEIGPPSTASASRDHTYTANHSLQLHDTIDSLFLLSQHGSQEVKQTKTTGITISKTAWDRDSVLTGHHLLPEPYIKAVKNHLADICTLWAPSSRVFWSQTLSINVGHDKGVIHRRRAAGIAILRVLSVIFLYICPHPPLRSWTWLYHQKANETYIPKYIVHR